MPSRRIKYPSSALVVANRNALRALNLLADYNPANSNLTKDALIAIEAQLSQAEEREFQLETSLAATRATRVELGRKLHDAMLGAKAAVISQYGPDSDAVASLGLKKKSEYRRPARRAPKTEA